ncbi:19415_t:CDS:1, partial [Gigaspora rosea]
MENDDINIGKGPGHKKRLETENVTIESKEIDDKTEADKNSDNQGDNQGKKIVIKDIP